MKTKINFFPVIRIALTAALFLIAAAAQNTFLSKTGLPLVLLVPAGVSVCAFEGEFAGLFFGMACGALYDVASPAADGIFALLFAVMGCAAGLLIRYVFRSTFLSVFIITLAASFLTAFTAFVFTVAVKDASNALSVFTGSFLPGALLTPLTLPLFYYPVKYYETRLKKT